ncbi:hypothetical protein MOBT1_001034 [Malassezia obtusa]|uniref:Uncharacterized protein n=1 Tax=Malassezia obtusa TaxID=76774 RepID=A0AAF0E2H6_9BASI|nr:hypothetical protein MOBT1_001034 [Malassezia obtusa]
MFAKTLAAFALVSAAVVAADDFTVDTPTGAAQCQPLQITWHGGQAPYYPSITKEGDISSVIKQFPQAKDSKLTWKVTVPAGQKFTIAVRDSTGQQKSSAPVAVGKGSSDCKDDDDSNSSGGGGGGAAAGGGGSSGSSSKGGDGDDKKSSSSGGKSSSSGSSKSSDSKSSSKGGDGDDKKSSAGGAGGAGGSSSSQSSPTSGGGSSGGSENSGENNSGNSGEKKGSNSGAASFSGLPAVVAGVVGVAVAALI